MNDSTHSNANEPEGINDDRLDQIVGGGFNNSGRGGLTPGPKTPPVGPGTVNTTTSEPGFTPQPAPRT